MKRSFTKICGMLALLMMTAVPLNAEVKTGDRAPDFALAGSDGKVHKLSDYKGKVVIVAWFPKAFTGGWTAQCDSLRVSGVKNGFDLKLLGDRTFSIAAREKGSGLDKFDVAFFTASCDTAETNQRYAESLQLDYPILSDPQKKTARTYGVVNDERPVPFRWTYIIGVNGKILHVDKQVNAKSHGADLVKKLRELGVREK